MNSIASAKVHEVALQHRTVGAVPHAINTGAKYMLFRPFTKTDIGAYEKFHKYAQSNFEEKRNSINDE